MRKPPFYRSLAHAIHGLVWILRNERNYQIEMLAFLFNLFLMVFLPLTTMERALIILVCFLVLITEILNTAIEKLCDMVKFEYDERIKIIKDISAGAVVLSAVCALMVGIFVYPKYLLDLF